MNQFKKTVQSRSDLYNNYIKLINGILGLTEKQVLVLSKIMELEESTPINKKLFSKENRNEIIESCHINECNLSTYLTLFKAKDILVGSIGQWSTNSSLFPVIDNNEIKVIFNITQQ
jgi:hypothetical protein